VFLLKTNFLMAINYLLHCSNRWTWNHQMWTQFMPCNMCDLILLFIISRTVFPVVSSKAYSVCVWTISADILLHVFLQRKDLVRHDCCTAVLFIYLLNAHWQP
jgi:hypothetical protein